MTDQVIPVQNESGQGEEVQALRAQLDRMKQTVVDAAREADRLRAQRDELLAQLRSIGGSSPPRCRASVRSGADPEMGEPCGEPIDPYCPRHRDQPDTRHKPGCVGHCGPIMPGGWPACWTDPDPARTPERTTTVPMTPEEEDLATKNLIRDTAPGPDDSRTAAFSSADVGKLIRFPWTGNAYRIAAVNEEDETVTFEVLGDPGDRATETFADLADVDAQVQP